MRRDVLMLVAVSALAAPPLAGAAPHTAPVEIKDAVARVIIVPEDRADVAVEIVRPNARLPLTVRTFGGRTIVDGKLGSRVRGCHGSGEGARVSVRGVGDVAWADMPQVVVHTPRDVQVEAGGAIFGQAGRSRTLELANAGCGDWTVANVEGAARITQAGSGNTRMGASGGLTVRSAGSGDVTATNVRGPLEISIAGSGSANVRSMDGPLSVSIAGSGDVNVQGGRARAMKVTIGGSGDVGFGGVADSLTARIAGSGDVRVADVKGPVSKAVMGSGSVRVGE